MAEPMFLTREQVAELTGARTRTQQIANLRENSVSHTVDATGWPVVAAAAIAGVTPPDAVAEVWPEVMDLATAARYLRFHPGTMRKWKGKGLGPPGKKIGGSWRFLKSALDAYIKGEKQPSWPGHLTDLNRAGRKASSGCVSPPQADARYFEALGLPTARKPRNGPRDSTTAADRTIPSAPTTRRRTNR